MRCRSPLPSHLQLIANLSSFPLNQHFLDLVNSDFSSQDEVNKLLDTWEEENPTDNASISEQDEEDVQDGVTGGAQRSFMEDLMIMFRRHASLIVRDPVLYLGRCVMILITNVVFAFVYWNARKWEQSQAPNKHFLNIWFAGVATNSKFTVARRV